MGSLVLLVRGVILLPLAGLAACASAGPAPVGAFSAAHVECVPFARALTGISLSGNAPKWWADAEPRYQRTQTPATGSILAFRATARLPYGHVSVVSDVISNRQILVTQANWVHGHITEDEPVVDISAGNDWSLVRVWWQPSRALGVTAYPTYGFILPEHRLDHDSIAAQTGHAAAIAVAYHPRE